ncbi:MAG: SMI1/KNR4 family protein, partial [Neisseria sp.]|nr:SMI1/KNR4 family protein [Neisseria sp.]
MDDLIKEEIRRAMSGLPDGLGRMSNRVQKEWITAQEERFHIALPDEYKWFVLNYDFIVLWGEPIANILNFRYNPTHYGLFK